MDTVAVIVVDVVVDVDAVVDAPVAAEAKIADLHEPLCATERFRAGPSF